MADQRQDPSLLDKFTKAYHNERNSVRNERV